MSGFSDERQAIEERFNTNWGTTSPVKWENVEFVQPQNTAWVALRIMSGEGKQVTLQGPTDGMNRWQGSIVIEVNAPGASGTEAAKTLADTAAGIFRRQNFSQGSSGLIRCRIPWIDQVGVNEAGWYQLNVICPYTRTIS